MLLLPVVRLLSAYVLMAIFWPPVVLVMPAAMSMTSVPVILAPMFSMPNTISSVMAAPELTRLVAPMTTAAVTAAELAQLEPALAPIRTELVTP